MSDSNILRELAAELIIIADAIDEGDIAACVLCTHVTVPMGPLQAARAKGPQMDQADKDRLDELTQVQVVCFQEGPRAILQKATTANLQLSVEAMEDEGPHVH